jgi:sulfur-oxidizing protein SoxZ
VVEPIRIRARCIDRTTTEVHVLMPHAMETGLRKDEAGQFIAAHYITDVELSIAGRTVLSARLSQAVSRDPLLFFRCKGARPGDLLKVAWTDSRGERRADEALVA